MTTPIVIFENNDIAAHAVYQYISDLRPSPPRFTLRPYQYQVPKSTEWWLVPSTAWPAYRFSKLCFHQYRPAPEYLYTGYYVEQGLGSEVAGLPNVKPTYLMKSNWYWHKFLSHVGNGALDTPLREVLRRSERPVIVSADVYEFNRVPRTTEERRKPDDALEFAIRSPDLQFETTVEGTKILSVLNECASLRELGHCLQSVPNLNWYWVNLVIGIRLRYGDESTGTWGAAHIWRNALEPWMPWVH